MSRRTFEGHMDWEYQNARPIDPSSPFGRLSQEATMSSFGTSSRYNTFGAQAPNPFAAAASKPSPAKDSSHRAVDPPRSSQFNPPPLPKQFAAPQFRNPAFTTPQKRLDPEPLSECSAVEDSPALTDTSEFPADTPEMDRTQDLAQMTVSPSRTDYGGLASRLLTRGHASGRGEVPRGRPDLVYLRDKVRKRRRQPGDRDVGSVRSRLPHDSDDSDSDWPERTGRGRSSQSKKAAEGGWFRNVLGVLHDHPNIPAILAGYIHLLVWILLVSLGLYCLWGFITTFRSDIALAGDHARAELLEEIRQCTTHYLANQCSRMDRPPALNEKCIEWETCMNQDAERIHQVQVSAKNVAEIVNEFAGVLSLKAYGLIVSVIVLCLLAARGFSSMSQNKFDPKLFHAGLPPSSQAAMPSLMAGPGPVPNYQPYFPHTPGRVKAVFFSDGGGTDTEGSPSDIRAIMPPPQTPSARRSPSKGDKGRSPTKLGRSPSKID